MLEPSGTVHATVKRRDQMAGPPFGDRGRGGDQWPDEAAGGAHSWGWCGGGRRVVVVVVVVVVRRSVGGVSELGV